MIRVILDKAMDGVEGLMSWFLRSTQGEYGSKKSKEGGTDINKPGRRIRPKR
jgi:hypothetical protein